jgi:ABC-type amino acid transport system permease subunit
MKEYIDSIVWSEVWEFSKQFILPNIGWFLFWTVLFIILGLILGIIFNRILYKKNIFTRDRKYYNWIAKLWIPYFMVVFLYFFAMIGLLYGGKSVLKSENKNITANILKQSELLFHLKRRKKIFCIRFNCFLILQKISVNL